MNKCLLIIILQTSGDRDSIDLERSQTDTSIILLIITEAPLYLQSHVLKESISVAVCGGPLEGNLDDILMCESEGKAVPQKSEIKRNNY